MKELDIKYKLISAFVILLIVCIVICYIYSQGKKACAINQSSPVIDNPNDPTQNTTPQTPQNEIDQMSVDIHSDFGSFYGLTDQLGHNMDLWNKVLVLSDTDLVRLNNAYNTKYQSQDGTDFFNKLNSQSTVLLWNGDTWSVVKQALIDRLTKLNIS